jgi:hypothetical protein
VARRSCRESRSKSYYFDRHRGTGERGGRVRVDPQADHQDRTAVVELPGALRAAMTVNDGVSAGTTSVEPS